MMEKLLKQLDDHLTLSNYSEATRRSYRGAIRNFYIWCQGQQDNPDFDKDTAHRQYLVMRYNSGKAWMTVNGDYSAIKMLYKNVLNREWDEKKLPRPRSEARIPEVLSKEEMTVLIAAGHNFKHRVLMALLYGTGLRIGEAVNLRVADIDFNRMQVHVVKGKGARDRMVVLPEKLKLILGEYIAFANPENYIFYVRSKKKRLSIRGAQHAIHEAVKDAGIKKRVSAHTFRHCYATHHLEMGTDLITLQKQMGHKHLKTTAGYVHLCMEHFRRIHHPINDVALCLDRENTVSGKSCESLGSGISLKKVPA